MEEEAKLVEENETKQTSRLKKRALVAGFLTAAFFASVTYLVWNTVENDRRAILQSAGQITASSIAQQVKTIVNNNLSVLESFADNWQSGPPEDEREYLSVATPLQSRFPALQAVNWITPNYIILYVAPIKGNVPAMGADLKRHPLAGPVLDIALDQRRTQITPTLELMQGGRGFAAYSPVLGSDGEIIGIINGAFRIRSMLASVINTEQVEDYTVRVREGDTVLFEIRGEGDDETLQRTVSFEVVGRQWQVDVIADPKLAQTTVNPELVVIFGSLTTVLFTIIMFLLTNRQKAPLRRSVHHINVGDDINDLSLSITRLDGHLKSMSSETAEFFDLREEDYGFIRFYNLAPEFQSDGTASRRSQEKMLLAINRGDEELRREWIVRSAEGVHVVCNLAMKPSTTHPDCVDITLHHNPAANASVNRLRYLATHDPLTGLPNHALFEDRLNQAVAHAKRYEKLLSVLVVDIDNFRAINDRFGADVGDETLRTISGRLRATVREKDTCARFSGDMFAIIATDLSEAEGAALVAERVVEAMSQPILTTTGDEIRLHVSVGVALYPNDARAPSQLMANADAAMYRAQKSAESSYCFFVETMNNVMHARLSMETQLRRAVDEKRFVLEYQPRYRTSDRNLTGFEALLRWIDDSGKRRLPPDFIAVADRTGLLSPLGHWIIETVCKQLAEWRKQGYAPVPIALNVSSRQFIQADLIKNITDLTSEYEIDPAMIEIEVSEEIAMRDPERALGQFYRFAEAGIGLTLDHFAAANTSLRYLKRFPVQRIKLSKSLFSVALDEQPENSVLQPAIRLCKSLNRKVVAVGVETEEQMASLQAAECDEIQGFLLSAPRDAADTTELLIQQNKPQPAPKATPGPSDDKGSG
ncbi:EAL domain-containing protein [Thalassospira sp.]|uniref:bifunctional diguanylate cyclase/phosphodiesterase n=1 Tax=Thalassospira sp. TaxID=1912094 RepID=UPI001B1CC3EA|nr:EAL domain-containing protein [Thalassospira sp.]MBO6808358.1 EAL domain-containing protein [Thalassospira sp.]MBO6839269.1 EAL domain-containing protein [Thalassospira sp.]